MRRGSAVLLLLAVGCTPPSYRLPLTARPADAQRDSGEHRGIHEWWYWTGHLEAADGRRFGFELTFFDVATPPGVHALGILPAWWFQPRVLIGHVALTDAAGRRFLQAQKTDAGRKSKSARGHVSQTAMDVRLDDWGAREVGSIAKHHLDASTPDFRLDLIADSAKPAVLHGAHGVQAAGPAGVSYYVSQTRMKVGGTVQIGGETIPVTGLAWHDHQWGSWKQTDVHGWDWYGFQLDDQTELMLYHVDPPSSGVLEDGGTFVDAAGQGVKVGAKDFSIAQTGRWSSPAFGRTYPMGWRIEVPSQNLSLLATPVLENQEFDGRRSIGVVYWEGAVELKGSRNGAAVTGRGYVELTNYSCKPVLVPDAKTREQPCPDPVRVAP